MDKLKIMVVDDESRMRKLVKDFLKKKDFEVIEAADGEEALDIFFKDKSISLIICDVMMPKINGFDVVKEIRQYSQVPIIMLTAKGEENHLQMEHLISMLEKEQVIDITEEELDSLYRIMTKIKKNLIRIQVGGEEEEYASDNFERSERI